MAVPKSKVSKQRRNKRRSAHWKLSLPNLIPCPKCRELTMRHQACKACGSYAGREVLNVDSAKK